MHDEKIASHFTQLDATHVLLKEHKVVQFCIGDALGLSRCPEVKKSAIKSILQWGTTSSSPSEQARVEQKLAELLKKEVALLFPSRFQAFLLLASFLHTSSCLLLAEATYDEEILALVDCEVLLFRDEDELGELLEKTHSMGMKRAILIESVTSREGKVCDLAKLAALSTRTNSFLIVDDSNAFGAMGADGLGLAATCPEVDLIIGNLSRAGAAPSAYLACKRVVKESLHGLALKERSLPPASLGAIESALEWIVQMDGERKQLQQRAHWLRNQLHDIGFSTGQSSCHLIPLCVESAEERQLLLQSLQEAAILPSSDGNEGAITLHLNVHHTPENFHHLLEALKAAAAPAISK
jgi:8-amino-7-oxononanoate synthase